MGFPLFRVIGALLNKVLPRKGADYYFLAPKAGVQRWPSKRITVACVTTSTADAELLWAAVGRWQTALNDFGFEFARVPVGAVKADIVMTFDTAGSPLVPPTTGWTHTDPDLPETTLTLATCVVAAAVQGNEARIRTAAHEFGHALGLSWHSNDRGDCMFSQQFPSNISKRDVRTMLRLYGGG